ncbi:MAG: ribonuclease P protein component [Campylobacterota bacterium]|nr:ribonuclease P protein component [Campylobacterota bacterium]
MSYLSKDYRLNSQRDFSRIYRSGSKWHTHSFVAFFMPDEKFSFGFVTSKKIGNAVVRNKARRRLRAVVNDLASKLKTGKYIFVAKDTLAHNDYDKLKKDFHFAFKRLELYK